ncbi:MAG: pyrimidine 5'-nucleotidase [Acidobacteria bacterium]|nr:pyrimidine 5'-nucleotidase [Acidobacteriota bacterium]
MRKNLRYALFDLDNTIYPKSCGLMHEIGNRINRYMVERLGIDEDEVSRRRVAFLKKWGTTLNALRRHYSVDPDEFLDFVHDIRLNQYLQKDPALDGMLGRLKLRKVVFTNADARHARRVLSHAGVLRHFEMILDIHMLDFINKPDRRAYSRILDFIDARPEECILIEDSPVNIHTAKELGMVTVMVGSEDRVDGAHYHIQRITDFEDLLSSIPE